MLCNSTRWRIWGWTVLVFSLKTVPSQINTKKKHARCHTRLLPLPHIPPVCFSCTPAAFHTVLVHNHLWIYSQNLHFYIYIIQIRTTVSVQHLNLREIRALVFQDCGLLAMFSIVFAPQNLHVQTGLSLLRERLNEYSGFHLYGQLTSCPFFYTIQHAISKFRRKENNTW